MLNCLKVNLDLDKMSNLKLGASNTRDCRLVPLEKPEEDTAMMGEPNLVSSNDKQTDNSKVPMDMNMYATRKTIAQGIMDLGLMCANASQLKYVLLNSVQHRYFQVTISLISLSIILQIIVGIVFILLGRCNINYRSDQKKADLLNNISVILIFLITVVNVLITAFGPSESPQQQSSWTNFYPGKLPPNDENTN